MNNNSSSQTTFLADLMARRGMSIDGLADRLRGHSVDGTQPDSSLVWKWVNARTRPSRRYLALLASVLDVEIDLLRLRIEEDYRRRTDSAQDGPPISDIVAATSGRLQFPPEELIDRRVVVKALLLSSGAGAMVELYDAIDRNTLSRASAEGLSIATNHLGCNFDRYDLFELQTQLDFHMSFVGRHLRESLTIDQRAMLCVEGARLAGMAASVAFLTGNVHGATVFDDISFRLAREVSDRRIMSWLLSEEAGMACYAGEPARALELLERANNVADIAQRANAASNTARAHAQLGDRAQVTRAVEGAERYSLDIPVDEDSSISGPHWSFSQISGFTRIAESWLDVDMPRQALNAIDHAMSVSAAQANPRLVAHARLISSAAQVRLGDVDGACETASEVFASNPQDFHTIAQHAKPLFVRLSSFENSTHVIALRAEFDHYLRQAPSR